MRILRIIESADPADGGPIEGVLRVGEALRARGHRQDLATLDPPGAAFIATLPATVHALGDDRSLLARHVPRRVLKRLGYAPGAAGWIAAHAGDYDVAIVSGLWNRATMAARRALVGGALPYVVFTHGMLDPWFRETYPRKHLAKSLLWRVNEGVLLRHAAAVLFTSEEERLRARDAFRPYHVRERVLPYGTADIAGDPAAEAAAFRALLPALGQRRFLLFLSRIHAKKGCDLLIDAFAALAGGTPGLDLVVAGPDQAGLRAMLEQRAADRGVAARIHWPGMLAGATKWGAFHACDAFVLPSHQENFGIVVAEAMACARPVLISDKVNIWREIAADGAGLVETDDIAGTRALIERFLALDEDERARMGARGRASFLARYEIGTAARALAAVLEEATLPLRPS